VCNLPDFSISFTVSNQIAQNARDESKSIIIITKGKEEGAKVTTAAVQVCACVRERQTTKEKS